MQVVSARDLEENPSRVLDSVRGGEPAVVERHGRPAAAIIDILDYHLLRAAAEYQSRQPEVDLTSGLTERRVAACDSDQARYALVLAHFLSGGISLGRAAELLGLSYPELRLRLHRLGLPTLQGPESPEDVRMEAEAARAVTHA